MGKGKKITLAIMLVLTVIMALMSAIGGSCPAFFPERMSDPSSEIYISIMNNRAIFIIANILTYIAAIGITVATVVLFMKKSWFYVLAMSSSILGVISGAIPTALIMAIGGFTPSIMRSVLYAMVILLLVIFRKNFNKEGIVRTEPLDGKSKSTMTAALLFFPGVLVAIQTVIVGPTHAMPAADIYMAYGMIEAIQIGIGILLIAGSILVFAITRLRARK